MRTFAMLGWLLVPLLLGAYHYGPGQDRMTLDDVARVLASADRHSADGRWDEAAKQYDRALGMLPPGRENEARRIRLGRDKAQILARRLPEANADLKDLVDELQVDKATDPALLREARQALANSQFYKAWLMRLEGIGRDQWEPELEGARQTFRLLAEDARKDGDRVAARERSEDLEGVIRLARMEPGELQGLPIPKQCQGCKSGQCKKAGRCASKNGQKSKDARGASSGPPPDDSGS